MSRLLDQQLERIKEAIFAGRRIEAIKLHREATGLGLKESKDAVEELEALLRQTEGHRFIAKPAAAGCFSIVCATLGISGGAIAAWLFG